tara:strand:- start:261 stop:1217 length:957 start_codon:yes stop_codon:yes gene_type:complete
MTQFPNQFDINTQSQDGDTTFENLWVFGQFNYTFENDDIKIRSIDVKEPSFFQKSVTLSGDLNLTGSASIVGDVSLDELNARNANFTGITTTKGDLNIQGTLKDENGATGNAGTILSSTGNGVEWIAANTTSVNNSINVGVNEDATNANQFVSFFGANSGNQPNRVDNDFTYNPSTNTLTVGTIVSTVGGAFVQGMIVAWSGSVVDIPNGFVLCDGTNNTPDLRDRFIIGANDVAAGSSYPGVGIGSTGGSADAVVVEHKHTTSVDNRKLFPAAGGAHVPYGGAGGYPGTIFTMNNEGVSGTNKNLPPYHALCFIMKT